MAPARPQDAPFTKVFAVIGQNSVGVFSKPRARAVGDLAGVELWIGVEPHKQRVAARKLHQRDLLDRALRPHPGKTGIMNDIPRADVDTVMCVTAAFYDNMGAKG